MCPTEAKVHDPAVPPRAPRPAGPPGPSVRVRSDRVKRGAHPSAPSRTTAAPAPDGPSAAGAPAGSRVAGPAGARRGAAVGGAAGACGAGARPVGRTAGEGDGR